MKDKVILNLINLGNVIRDEGDINTAISTYNEALIYTKEYKLKKDEARIYWIFAGIYRDKKDIELSLQYAQKSVEINLEINYYYGVANASREMAETLLAMGQKIEAAKALETSAAYYKKISHFATNYQIRLSEAINIYFQEGENDKANELLNELITSYAENTDIPGLVDLIIQNKSNTNVNEKFQLVFNNYFTKKSSTNIAPQILSYIEYCKSLGEDTRRNYFTSTLHFIIEHIGEVRYSYSILGIAIEQSGKLLETKELFVILNKLQKKLPAFFVRERNNESIIITTINNKINLEFLIFNDEPVCIKLMLALILLLNEIHDNIFNKTPLLEEFSIVWVNSFSEEYQKIFKETQKIENPFNELYQTIHTSKTKWDIQDFIIVNNEYEQHNNINENAESKCSLCFFVNAIANIKSHFYHMNVMKNNNQRKQIMNLIAGLMGYHIPPLKNIPSGNNDFKINFDELENSTLQNNQ